MADTAPNTTRRAVIGALVAAPIVLAAPVAMAGTTPSRAVWDAAVRRVERTAVVLDQSISALDKAQQAYFDSRPPRPSGPVLQLKGRVFTMDEAMANSQAEYEAWERADKECSQQTGANEAGKREEASCRENAEARTALISTPAPDLSAIIHKIELFIESGMEAGEIALIICDLDRLGAAS